MTLGLSHVAMAGALAACAAGIGGYFHGVSMGVSQEQAAQKRADDAREAERQKLQGQIDASNERFQAGEYARQSAVREIYHESQKVIERPVYRNVCVDADGVGLLDRAAATANRDDIWGIAGDTRPIAERPAD
ncbi:hypothetical protein FHS51_001743 [Sphingobium wenxiniae]|uniref:Uncharacterized protein n=1 Tax=Sphingobium wenxiniae (strain DSM 21828 / CGMCC 1.7748 / JZ-1) TaxID=595605 RepID=A0A562KDA3_SPHWJ|nr:hypothetical protein [Sphingobium wenxiniae]MBB6191516.1 hypothetical protein [Sphingobium wenxiniae]TWH93195.1 hypothetical protein IQ35_02102 [Sphingobium wenxiniae]